MKNTAKNSAGFTLLELLVTMALVAILIGIAVPQYSDYRRRGFDIRAASDLKNVATAEEAYFIDYEAYLSCTDAECAELPGIRALSRGTTLSISAAEDSFTGTSTHPQGTGRIYTWDSEGGGLQD
jgi:prepilin-type N-terminal cleavage/methylation domain-containing protein